MLTTVLQFATLVELATYSQQVHARGYRINVQKLTLRCRLTRDEVEVAEKKYSAILLAGTNAEA